MPSRRPSHGMVSTHASVRRRHPALAPTMSVVGGFNSRLREEATRTRRRPRPHADRFNSRLREEATPPCRPPSPKP